MQHTFITAATGGVSDLAVFLACAAGGAPGAARQALQPLPVLAADAALPPLCLALLPPCRSHHLWCSSAGAALPAPSDEAPAALAFALDASALARGWLGGSGERAARAAQEAAACLLGDKGGGRQGQQGQQGQQQQQQQAPPGVLLVGGAAALAPVGDAVGAEAGALAAARRLLQGAPLPPSPTTAALPAPLAPLTEAQCACLQGFVRLLALGLGAALAALPCAPAEQQQQQHALQLQHVLQLLQPGAAPAPAAALQPDRLLLPRGHDSRALALAALPAADAAWGAALAAEPLHAWPAALRAGPPPPSFQASSARLGKDAREALLRQGGAWAADGAAGLAALRSGARGVAWETWAEALVTGQAAGGAAAGGAGQPLHASAAGSRAAGGGGGRLSVGPRSSLGGRRSLGGGGGGGVEGGASAASSRSSSVSSVASATAAVAEAEAAGQQAQAQAQAPAAVAAAAAPPARDPKKFFSLLAAGGAARPPARGGASAKPPP
jgi:hypothetical protein